MEDHYHSELCREEALVGFPDALLFLSRQLSQTFLIVSLSIKRVSACRHLESALRFSHFFL